MSSGAAQLRGELAVALSMIRSFVSTVRWFAHNVTNRCAALLMQGAGEAAIPATSSSSRAAEMRIATELPTIPTPPPVSGVTGFDCGLPFDRASFDMTLTVHALRVPPELCSIMRTSLRSHMLSLHRTQSVQKPAPSEQAANGYSRMQVETRPAFLYLLLRYLSQARELEQDAGNLSSQFCTSDTTSSTSTSAGAGASGVDGVIEALRTEPKRGYPASVSSFLATSLRNALCERTITLSHDSLSAEGVLRRLLPSEITVPTSFETVGSLIHLNLRPEHTPYKRLIGSVLLDKHAPRIRTVVNKTANTGGPYRTFQLEVLAGALDTRCRVRENGCTYELDFAAVYWNSRLETEHRRIVDSVNDGEVFVDLFAGIGPFALPVAKRGKASAVFANDLNPSSIAYLARNATNNGVADRIEYNCGCARDFVTGLVQRNVRIDKIVMNFPAGAPEFLDVFRGLYNYSNARDSTMPMPTIFCYCFVRDGMHEARERVRAALFDGITDPDTTIPDRHLDVRRVRDVAPRKIQVCATFKLPESVAYARAPDEAPVKKVKVMVTE